MIRTCIICKKEFVPDRHGNTGQICACCRNKYHRKKLKRKAIEYKGGKCQKCGYDKCDNALEFHHVNPEEKEFQITGTNISWEKIKIELDKCILLCANCHREKHASEQPSFEDYQKFIGNKTKIAKKKKTNKRKVVRPETYDLFIKEMDELNWNYCAMGRKYGVSDNAIRKWEKNYIKNESLM